MNEDFMEVTFDKFVFRVAKTYLYHPEESWAKGEEGLVRVGVSDFLQKTVGDVAFFTLPPAGEEIETGGFAGTMETIKTTVDLVSPVSGIIREVNPALEDNPQLVNLDPYGEGWVMKVEPRDWEADQKKLLSAASYFPLMEEKIKKEMAKK